ncbi:MAG: Wzz/FepE/Etk N-terminal domain-containing protein [Acidithiobacillus ferrivorans]
MADKVMTDNQGYSMLPANQTIASMHPEDEISLLELWDCLWQGKWTVILVTILFMVLSGIYLYMSTPIYQSKAMVQIGRVAGQPLKNSSQLGTFIKSEYTPINTQIALKQLPILYAVTLDKNDPSTLILVSRAKSPEQAQNYLQIILRKLLASEKTDYEHLISMRQSQLKTLQNQYQHLVTEGRPSNKKNVGATDEMVILLGQSQRFLEASGFLSQISEMQDALSSINSSPSKIVQKPTYDSRPISPKKILILVLALLGGLIVGIFIVLLRRSLSRPANEVISD